MATGRKTGGRRKGTPNKTTASVKAAFEEAFDRMGGVDALVSWAASDPGEFFKLYAKLLPIQLRADLSHNVTDSFVEQLERAETRREEYEREERERMERRFRQKVDAEVARITGGRSNPGADDLEPDTASSPSPDPAPPPKVAPPPKPKPKPTPYQPISHLPDPLPYGGSTMDPDYTPLKD